MSYDEHYEKAEELLDSPGKAGSTIENTMASAQVHATLALADAVRVATQRLTDGLLELTTKRR